MKRLLEIKRGKLIDLSTGKFSGRPFRIDIYEVDGETKYFRRGSVKGHPRHEISRESFIFANETIKAKNGTEITYIPGPTPNHKGTKEVKGISSKQVKVYYQYLKKTSHKNKPLTFG